MKSRGIRLTLSVVLWAVVAVQTFDVVRGHFASKEMFTWLLFVLLATALTLPMRRWPLKVRVPVALLVLSAAGYNLYLTGVSLAMLWMLLVIALSVGAGLALRRWAPWPWLKSEWTLFALAMGGTAIGLWLAVALKA
ncbi:MAG TPA: hypothetical protein VGW33_09570 [Terriglobia bacterium]|nr:hypothetical protein [Terriglobia bacterium]